MAGRELTAKQLSFCLNYIKHFNASQAALDAGYSKINYGHIGWELLQKTTIQQRLQELTAKQAEKAELSVEWIIKELKQMYERCQSSLRTPGAIAGATKQLELLGKHLAMFSDKLIVKHDLSDLLGEIEDESERGLPKVKKQA